MRTVEINGQTYEVVDRIADFGGHPEMAAAMARRGAIELLRLRKPGRVSRITAYRYTDGHYALSE